MRPVCLYRIVYLTLLAIGLVGVANASDWEEDTPAARRDPETPGSTVKVPASHGEPTVLRGSATTVRTMHPPTSSAMQAQQAQRDREVYAADAEADRFMATAQTNVPAPPQVFRNWIQETHPDFFLKAESKDAGLVINIKGQWDNSSKPLGSLGIKQTSLKEKSLRDVPLDHARVMIVNCAGEVPKDALQRVRDFVAHGGYLISTDWSLENVVQRAFPGYIGWSGENTNGDVVDAYIVDQDPVLFKGVTGRRATWKLDRGSQTVKVYNPRRVRVLVRSTRLATLDPNARIYPDRMMAGAVALEFKFGRGKVLHLVGHYDNCGDHPHRLPDPAPGIGISLRQALITNFILDALTQEPATTPPGEPDPT